MRTGRMPFGPAETTLLGDGSLEPRYFTALTFVARAAPDFCTL